ncbi:MAG TPA: RidA family protein [Solirubrobacteraceae bacterium]|jgi:2-iminobutanoate/2-iminopropanoate deaminase|nr:RidA family protein [Solirubrobacteraceae bacterium]
MAEREGIVPQGGGSRYGYSPGLRRGDVLYVSGQVPIDPATGSKPEAFADQVRLTLENVRRVAVAAGGRLEDAVRVGVYLTDLANFEAMDAIYRTYFEDPLPARTTIQAGLNAVQIEIDAIIALNPAAAS